MHKQMLRDYFNSFDFAEQWERDEEVIKSYLKKHRQVCKMLALALAYGMQPKKMVKQMLENGYVMSFRDAKAFYAAYWQLFSGVRQLADRLEAQCRQDGYLVNEFGYRLTPDPRKAFNAMIQSSVSGIVHILTAKLFALAPWARFSTIIHDEILAECPVDRVEEFRQAKDEAARLLNEELGWSVNIRVGFAVGATWFEAK
jgi:DNA polymerase I-like protein with 3'-5' exonuclease and polymerase domains